MEFGRYEKVMLCITIALIIFAAIGDKCDNCKLLNNVFAIFCNYCGEPLIDLG